MRYEIIQRDGIKNGIVSAGNNLFEEQKYAIQFMQRTGIFVAIFDTMFGEWIELV